MKHTWIALLLGALFLGSSTSVPAQQDWRQEWEKTLAAAKKEGTVAVLGPRQVQARDVLRDPFQKAYGIKVVYLGGSGRTISPRVLTERRAQRYLWDVYVGGTTTGLTSLAPTGALAPLAPALILPEVKDPKYWRGGALDYADRAGRLQLAFAVFQRGILFINPKMVKAGEIRSYKDLLDPKWKGKIILDDPRKSGPGQGTFLFFYLHPQLGADYIRALAKQEVVLLKNYAQELDVLARGRYPLGIGLSDATAEYKMSQGLPLAIMDPRQVKEGSDTGAGNGAVSLMNGAPHPNAAKVYINWLLSKDAQTLYARGMRYVSSRLDVPTDHVAEWRIPRKDTIKTYTEVSIDKKKIVIPLARKVFGR